MEEKLRYWKPKMKLSGPCYSFGRTDCLDENTKIFIKRDNKFLTEKLKKLPNNFIVVSYDFENKKIVESNAEKIDSGQKELFEIKFSNGTKILASANHRFFDNEGNEVKVKDIKLDDNIGMKVKSIKKVGIGNTFDLHVPKYNNFFIDNGILSHNSGKSWKLTAMVQLYNSRFNYKIFDIGAGKRKENTFWCFPSNEEKLWKRFENIVGDMKNNGPKEYKVNLLYPCFSMKIPKKLPEHLPRISTKLFTIDFKTITVEDISFIIGDVPKSAIYYWNKIVKNLPNNANGMDIDIYVNKHLKKMKNLSIYRLFLKPAIDNNLLAGKNFPLNIDLIAECKEKDIISVLCHDYIPNKTWAMFIMGYMMRIILFDLAMNGKVPKENIGLFREAGDYMKKVDKDLEAGEQVQIFRNFLTKVARYGRSGLILFMDTQSPCLEENTSIKIFDNEIINKKIRDLPDKFNVISYDFKGKKDIICEAQKFLIGEREVYEIKLDNGKKVLATENHRFFNENEDEVFVRDLNVGDEILNE